MRFDLLIENVDIVSPGAPLRRSHGVGVRGETIAAVAPMDEFVDVVAAERIDGRGGLCAPGFVNVHNHTPLMGVRGMVEDLGFAPAYTKGIPQGHWLGDEETYALSKLGLAELLRQGCTTVVDFYARPAALARAMSETGLRGFVGGRIMDVDTAALADGRFEIDPALGEATFQDNLDLIADWDGAGEGRVACVWGPHAPDTCSPDLMRRVAELSAADGRLVHTHLAQSPMEVVRLAAVYGMTPVEYFDDVGLLDGRLTAAHCIRLTEADIQRLGASGAHVAHVPVGNATGGQWAPIEALAAAGANIALATDSKSGDMLEAMRTAIAVARLRADGRFVFDAATAFAWGVAGGAQALGLKARVGRIQAGMLADIVLFDPAAPNLRPVIDGVGILVHSGAGLNVDTAVVGGEVVLAGGRPTRFSMEDVVRDAQSVAERLWARARRSG